MDNLTQGEVRILGKWYARAFLHEDEYWRDVAVMLKDSDIPMPYRYNPSTVRLVQEALACSNCDGCCHYHQTPVSDHDFKRLLSAGVQIPELKSNGNGTRYMDTSEGCVFLEKKRCSVYAYRPDACWLFPIQRKTGSELLFMRVFCPSSVRAIRKIITEAMSGSDYVLLPNLVTIPKEEK